MQLTDHMRKHLIDGVIAAQKEDNQLLRGIDLQRLRTTLERDLSEEELASIMMLVGSNRDESMRAMCLTMIDKSQPSHPKPIEAENPSRSWTVEQPIHRGILRRLTHRSQSSMAGVIAQGKAN